MKDRLSEIVLVLKAVGLALDSKMADENYVVIAVEINKDFPNIEINKISDILFSGAKGHLRGQPQHAFMPYNLTTIFTWLECKLINGKRDRRIVV